MNSDGKENKYEAVQWVFENHADGWIVSTAFPKSGN